MTPFVGGVDSQTMTDLPYYYKAKVYYLLGSDTRCLVAMRTHATHLFANHSPYLLFFSSLPVHIITSGLIC